MATIKDDTNPVAAVAYAVLGGRFRVRIEHDDGPGKRSGSVLDDDGNVIGTASNYPYGARGYSVWTRPFAGFVPERCIDYVTDDNDKDKE